METSELFLEVDIDYPEDLHDFHNDYPLAPERIKIRNVEKNLNNRTSYVVHYEHVKLYESLGLTITKIHRGIKFEESAWREEYFNLNTKLRIGAKNSRNNFVKKILSS